MGRLVLTALAIQKNTRFALLGERGGEPGNVGILGVEYGAVIGLEEEGGAGKSLRGSQQNRSEEEAKTGAP